MESVQIIALLIFLITVSVIIWGKLDRAVVGVVGADGDAGGNDGE